MTTVTADMINAIKRSRNVLICGHIRPDGDCVSSAMAIRRICEKLGKNADAVCDADKPEMFGFLPDYERFCTLGQKYYDLFIAVDCAVDKRLGEYYSRLIDAENSINIDHHPTNNGYGRINHIVPEASSTCEIIYDIFEGTDLIDKDVATMLYTGLSTDTGHFMHANTTEKVFQTAAGLAKYGIEIGHINHELYCKKSVSRIKLTARALNSIELYDGGKIAVMTIMLDTLAECGCDSQDTEGLIDNASSISGVKIAISMCEQPGGIFRVSLRSVSADVSAVAGTFGGGGHKLASGCIVPGTCADVKKRLVAAATAELAK